MRAPEPPDKRTQTLIASLLLALWFAYFLFSASIPPSDDERSPATASTVMLAADLSTKGNLAGL